MFAHWHFMPSCTYKKLGPYLLQTLSSATKLTSLPVWPVKSCQTSIKVTQNDFTKKMKDFDNFTKITWECGQFGQINCCHRVWKIAQSAIDWPIWSHRSLHQPFSLSSFRRRIVWWSTSNQSVNKLQFV